MQVKPSFPFIEQNLEGLKLKYDAIELENDINKGEVKITFYQGKFPIYRYSHELSKDNIATILFSDVSGEVAIKLKSN